MKQVNPKGAKGYYNKAALLLFHSCLVQSCSTQYSFKETAGAHIKYVLNFEELK